MLEVFGRYSWEQIRQMTLRDIHIGCERVAYVTRMGQRALASHIAEAVLGGFGG